MHVRPPTDLLASYPPPFGSARQEAEAFNQPLNFDTSSVKTMEEMFKVHSVRALHSDSGLEPSLARCMRGHHPTDPPSSWPTPRPAPCAPLSTRQNAKAFNQPLNFNTSSVTTMDTMFYVCTSPAPCAQTPVELSLARCMRGHRPTDPPSS